MALVNLKAFEQRVIRQRWVNLEKETDPDAYARRLL